MAQGSNAEPRPAPGEASELSGSGSMDRAASREVPSPGDVELRSVMRNEGAIGEGGTAKVFQVYDRQLRRVMAMKVLKPGCSAATRARFVQETLVTARLDHPAIVPVHCAGQDESGEPNCFTMKLVEGQTLAARLEEVGGPLRGRQLAELLSDLLRVCDALAFAHSRGVVHRDLKPDNIMLGHFGQVYVMDWGSAQIRDRETGMNSIAPARRTGEVVGTPCYMAPEQARGATDEIDERTDVYALGGILYEVLTYVPPHAGQTVIEILLEAKNTPVRPPEYLCDDDPPPALLSDIVMKALARRANDRFASMQEMRQALEIFLYAGAWFTRRRFNKGAAILREGDLGDCAYIVEAGECVVYRRTVGSEHPLRVVGPGEVLGELALIASGERTACVDAKTDVVLLEVSRETLERELPAGSWVRQLVDTLGARFLEYDRERMRAGK